MIEITNNNVLIPLPLWDELKNNEYFKELIEMLEKTQMSENTKKESTGSEELDEYIYERYNRILNKVHLNKNNG